jgi:hypothetical protein
MCVMLRCIYVYRSFEINGALPVTLHDFEKLHNGFRSIVQQELSAFTQNLNSGQQGPPDDSGT